MIASMRNGWFCLVGIGVCVIFVGRALAGSHTWDVNEVFSNADGTIQFIELREPLCVGNEVGLPNHNITSLTLGNSFLIPPPSLTPPTCNKHVLIATPAFAALPSAPTPDYILPALTVPFFSTGGDTIRYVPWDTFVFGAGALPTDGVNSLNRDLSTGCNTPTNYAGQTGQVNVGCTLLGDVDGSGTVDGNDVAAFVRAKLGTQLAGDAPACAEYCTGTFAGDIAAFVATLLPTT